MSNIFPGSAPFWQYSPIATSHLPSPLKKLQTLLIEYISGEGSGINRFSSFLTLRLTIFVWALCQSFWNKKSLNNNNFFQLEASMNLLNIFRKNKYYEQFCLKRLYKSHVIELTWRKANRANTGSLTIIFLTTWFKDGDL